MRLASRMNRLGTETTFEVLARTRSLEQPGRTIIHLEIGEPDFDTPQHNIGGAVRKIERKPAHS
jgi:aspartate aminotransferase